MTIQSFITLFKFRICQFAEGELIYIDYKNQCFKRMEPDILPKNKKYSEKSIEFSQTPSKLFSVLSSLREDGLIEWEEEDYLKVSHRGCHIGQIILGNVLHFLSHSILLPIVVSLITSIVVYLVGIWLGFPEGWH